MKVSPINGFSSRCEADALSGGLHAGRRLTDEVVVDIPATEPGNASGTNLS